MAQHLEKEIEKLKSSLLQVGTLVEEAVRDSVRSFSEKDLGLAELIIENDEKIDQLEVEVEEDCLKILALHQPVAIDLRYIIAVLKINNDLERIADLAVNIASRTKFLAEKSTITLPGSLFTIAEKVEYMLKMSLDSLVKSDTKKAKSVLVADDEVDDLHSKMYKIAREEIESDQSKIDQWFNVIAISRYLERAADHTTNIAEDVIYLVDGDITRHQQLDKL
tara:strand:- start:462 stop:1127 length:666 start_codon:yes stop_codon:yes gene_type:complete